MKVGDRVTVVDVYDEYDTVRLGQTATLIKPGQVFDWVVQFDDGVEDYFNVAQLELAPKTPTATDVVTQMVFDPESNWGRVYNTALRDVLLVLKAYGL